MATPRINNRRDILLLLLYSPGATPDFNEPIVGRTRLVKMLFLFGEEALAHFRRGTEITSGNFYEFFAWSFGPFSRQVYDDLTFFTLKGFIVASDTTEDALPESAAEWDLWLSGSAESSEDDSIIDYTEQTFRLSERGQKFAAELYGTLVPQQKRLLQQFKNRLSSAPLRSILRYVYDTYPELTDKSEIVDDVLGPR